MALTLTSTLGVPTQLDSANRLTITGTVSDAVVAGYLFRLGDEVLEFRYFGEMEQSILGGAASQLVNDPNVWFVERGLAGSAIVSHNAGTAVLGLAEALVTGEDEDTPSPFSSGGTVTPAAFIAQIADPPAATAEAVALKFNALQAAMIAADQMEPS